MNAKLLIAAAAGMTFATSVAIAQNSPDASMNQDQTTTSAAATSDQTGAAPEADMNDTTTGAAAGYETAGERG